MRIKVVGYLDISADEYDSGPMGPLTERAYMDYVVMLGLDDVEFTLEDES